MATIERMEHNKAKLTITIDAETFSAAVQQAYFKTAKHYNIPGFRKGHAPRKVIENMYGEGVFFEDAFELVWGDAYDAALEEHELTAVDKPSITIEKIGLDEGIVYTAEVQLKPEVTLGAYKGIEVEKPTYTVEDADVDREIELERERGARFISVERPVENGDRVVLDYSGSVDGVPFEGGTAEEQTLVIGSGTFIPGFEEQIVGMAIGQERDITVTFPTEYHAENLAGKEAVFHVKVREIQVKDLPALDDEFAKDVSEFDTLKAYEADVKKKIKERKEDSAEAALERKIIETVVENASVNVPQCMINDETEEMVNEFAYRLMYQGMNIDDYFKYTGQTPEKLKETYVEPATKAVKTRLVLEQVIKAAGIEVTPEDEEAVYADLASRQNKSVEEIKKDFNEHYASYIKNEALNKKLMAYLKANNTVK